MRFGPTHERIIDPFSAPFRLHKAEVRVNTRPIQLALPEHPGVGYRPAVDLGDKHIFKRVEIAAGAVTVSERFKSVDVVVEAICHFGRVVHIQQDREVNITSKAPEPQSFNGRRSRHRNTFQHTLVARIAHTVYLLCEIRNQKSTNKIITSIVYNL